MTLENSLLTVTGKMQKYYLSTDSNYAAVSTITAKKKKHSTQHFSDKWKQN
jgi:hypothetical protein